VGTGDTDTAGIHDDKGAIGADKMVITCDKPTPNHASGRALLQKYDMDKDGTIAMPEMMAAVADLKTGKITKEESEYVTTCWKLGAGGIDNMCPDCSRCDFNRDGYVNYDDAAVIKAAYDSRPGDSNWNPDADLNGDGIVNYKDLGILTKCWGPVAPPPEIEPVPEPVPFDWNPWAADGVITDDEIALAQHHWSTGTPINGHVITDAEISLLQYQWSTGDVTVVPATVPEPAAKRLTYKEALELVNAGLPVYIKFDIPILDQMPGIQWGPGIPILPGFMLTREP